MPRPRSVLLIGNPAASRRRGARTLRALSAELAARDVAVACVETTRRGHAREVAAEVARRSERRPDCVVACGGDGTIQEVADALAGARAAGVIGCPALGLAPAGRCNDFAKALGIPRDVSAIADVLISGAPRPIDLGRVNGHHFCTVATVGVDAAVSGYVESMRVPLTGTAAYLYGALRVLRAFVPPMLRLEGDFGVIERRLFLASTANTSTYGGSIPIVPDAVPDDGKLDLCVIDNISTIRALTLIPSVLACRHRYRPEVRFYRTARVRVQADRELELWADGERMGPTPATLEVVPAAIEVLLPA